MKILFVCTGNTCRSPMAEAICRHLVSARGLAIACASAGTAALPGDAAAAHAAAILADRGIDLSGHRARALTPADIDAADLILTMTAAHKAAVQRLNPPAAGKVSTLGEYVGAGDVPDPFGGSEECYRETAASLQMMLTAMLDRLAASSAREDRRMIVGIGCDHGGLDLKQAVIEVLGELRVEYKDFGTYGRDAVDYPDFARAVALAVRQGDCDLGVLICGTGIGISIAANKVSGIRAALCADPFSARMARAHNNANVLCLGGRVVGPGLAQDIVRAFFESQFAGGRHARRVEKIHAIEKECGDRGE